MSLWCSDTFQGS